MVVLASVVHLLRLAAIVSLLFAWVGAQIIQDYVYERASEAWARREAAQRTEESFEIPYWRFILPAAAVRFTIFGIWIGGLFVLLFVIPVQIIELRRFIPENFPF